jgi:sensor histidine kinase YesM
MGVPGWSIILYALIYNFLWAALWPLVSWLVRRVVRAGWRWPAHLALQLPAAAVLCLVHQSAYYAFYRLVKRLTGIDNYKAGWLEFLSGAVGFALIFYGLVVAAAYLVELWRMVDERQRRADVLQEELVVAQLSALKMQLQPHFLFNTLNSIQALMNLDVPAAQTMVARLANFLRATLSVSPDGLVPLQRELELAEAYLHIERVRFPDRLVVEVHADATVQGICVPALILQPLIENAIRHGIAPYLRPGRIRVRAEAADGALRLNVWDSGPGLPSPEAAGRGIGIANVRTRLDRQYGGAASLRLSSDPAGGFEALITIPLAA